MRPRRKAGAMQRELPDGETVVLGADGLAAIVLNPIGGVIWDLCEGSHDVEQIAALICDALTEADPARVRADVAAFVDQLVEAGLVEDGASCGPPPSKL